MQDIEHYNIPVCNFPHDVEDDDEESNRDNSELRVRVGCATVSKIFSLPGELMQALPPFAVIDSEEEIEIDGQPDRARILTSAV